MDFDLPPDRMAFWTAFLPGFGAGWRKTAFTSRKSATGQTPCPERLGEEGSCSSNSIPAIFPIFVRQPGGRFVKARYRNLAYPPLTWWEWKHTKKRL